MAMTAELSAPSFAAKNTTRIQIERAILFVLAAASGVAVLTTIGIVLSVLYESLRFFAEVPAWQFLFGTTWAPTANPPAFGILPLLGGTLLITVIAIAVAGPLGLFSAIYLAEYATPKVRAIAKPLLEMLAGIPTVVLGFFAALTVAPLIRSLGTSAGLLLRSDLVRVTWAGGEAGAAASPVVLEDAWLGDPLPPDVRPDVRERVGCDRDPVDLTTVEGRLLLTSYVWPDQRERL